MKTIIIAIAAVAVVAGLAVGLLASREKSQSSAAPPAIMPPAAAFKPSMVVPALPGGFAGITAKDHGKDLIPPGDGTEFWSIRQPDGTRLISTTLGPDPDVVRIPGAITERAFTTEHMHEASVVQAGVSQSRSERDACIDAFVKRGRKMKESANWAIGLRFKSDGKEVRVTEVVVPDSYWPSSFDQEMKDCYTKSYGAIHFPSTEQIDYLVEYPVCLTVQ